MSPAEAQKRIADLRAEVARHDELYYRQAQSQIEDYEYDQLKKELRKLEELHPQLAAELGESPLNRIGDDRAEGFIRTRHLQPMTTLENTYDESELREFHIRLSKLFEREDLVYSVEPKIDGASISLTYENGHLIKAVTRGDGEEGDDVTTNVLTITSLPRSLRRSEKNIVQIPETIEIRGEVFLRFDEFSRINQQQVDDGLLPYANPRNLAAGTLKLLDADIVKERKLEILLYSVGASEPKLAVNTQAALHATLAAWGLPILDHRRLTRGIEETIQAVRELDELRKKLAYATDGAVVKLDEFSLQTRAGFRGEGQTARKLSPRWACAYKFAPERAETRLLAITIQVGRTGVLTPVAELMPVQLAGTTVSRATLHNRDEIDRKDIQILDYVFVEKKGEIIPAVVKVNITRRSAECVRYVFPTVCPSCGSQVVQKSGEVAIRCLNSNCPEQLIAKIDYVSSRSVLDIEGLGGAVARKLVEKKVVRDFFDLFSLQPEILARLERSDSTGLTKAGVARKAPEVGEKNAAKILGAIKRARELELARWIMSMQIPDVGAATAQELAGLHGTFDALKTSKILPRIVEKAELEKQRMEITPFSRKNPPRDDNERADRSSRTQVLDAQIKLLADELVEHGSIPCIGPAVARSVIATFISDRGKNFLSKLSELKIHPQSIKRDVSGPLSSKTFVLTGSLSALDRPTAQKRIESLGGKVASSVSRKTDFVVAGPGAGSKLDDARKLGVSVLDEQAFIAMVGGFPGGVGNQDKLNLG